MSIDLTQQQRQALDSGKVVEVIDDSRILYVLSKQQYERVKGFLESEKIDPSFYEFTDIEMFGQNE